MTRLIPTDQKRGTLKSIIHTSQEVCLKHLKNYNVLFLMFMNIRQTQTSFSPPLPLGEAGLCVKCELTFHGAEDLRAANHAQDLVLPPFAGCLWKCWGEGRRTQKLILSHQVLHFLILSVYS